MIAVVGATGNTGRAVVKELTRLGQTPICVVRNPDKALKFLAGTQRQPLPNSPIAPRSLKRSKALRAFLW